MTNCYLGPEASIGPIIKNVPPKEAERGQEMKFVRIQAGVICNEAEMVRGLREKGYYGSGSPRKAQAGTLRRRTSPPSYLTRQQLHFLDDELFQIYRAQRGEGGTQ